MSWNNTGYLFKKQITLNSSQVSGGSDLSNYPALISVTDANLKTVANGGYVQNSSGFDLIFTDSTETTKLDHEIENYVATTGEIEMWVRIPTLSHSANTIIYMYFNDASISTSQANPTGVWDSNYIGVWHLKESGNGTAGEFKDSTSNANNGTGGNGTSGKTPTQTTGQIGKGQSFASASNQFIDDNSPTGMGTIQASQSIALWFKVTSNPGTESMLAYAEDSGSSNAEQFEFTGGGNLAMTNISGTSLVSTAVPTANAWHHLAWTWNGTTHTIYLDGVSKATSTTSPNTGTIARISFGSFFDNGGGTGTPYNGLLDEVEWSKTARTTGWITTQYNNQSAPGTFATFGSLIRIPGNFMIISDGMRSGSVSGGF